MAVHIKLSDFAFEEDRRPAGGGIRGDMQRVPQTEGFGPSPDALDVPADPNMEDYSRGPIQFETEDEEMLFGPTKRQAETFEMTARRPVRKKPQNLGRYMPVLIEAAESPNAPQELHDFLRVLEYHLGQGI